MSSSVKRSRDGSSRPSSKRAKQTTPDTLRFRPQAGNAAMCTPHLVQYYTQQYGQNLFMVPGNGYIDVKFVDIESAKNVWENLQDVKPPFLMQVATSIDLADIRVKSPGRVTMYISLRDVDHYDDTPCVPHGWTNPFPIKFQAPPCDTNTTEVVDPDPGEGPQWPPRFKPIYPRVAQPLPPSPMPPFCQPIWPAPDSILSPVD